MNMCSKKQNNEVRLIDTEKSFRLMEKSEIDTLSNRSNTIKIAPGYEELPKSYTSRKFLRNLAGFSYGIAYLPGSIVRYNTSDSNYYIVLINGHNAVLKENKMPTINFIENGMIYSNRIGNGASFNGSVWIANIDVQKDQIMELVIQDVCLSVAPDSILDVELLKKITGKNLFLVTSAMLSIINYKKFTQTNISGSVNILYIKVGGKTYASYDKFSRERVVSVDLISLDDIININRVKK